MQIFPIYFRKLSTFCQFFAETLIMTILIIDGHITSGHNGQFQQNSHNGHSCMGLYGHKYGQQAGAELCQAQSSFS